MKDWKNAANKSRVFSIPWGISVMINLYLSAKFRHSTVKPFSLWKIVPKLLQSKSTLSLATQTKPHNNNKLRFCIYKYCAIVGTIVGRLEFRVWTLEQGMKVTLIKCLQVDILRWTFLNAPIIFNSPLVERNVSLNPILYLGGSLNEHEWFDEIVNEFRYFLNYLGPFFSFIHTGDIWSV